MDSFDWKPARVIDVESNRRATHKEDLYEQLGIMLMLILF